jgi:hypothetical protein
MTRMVPGARVWFAAVVTISGVLLLNDAWAGQFICHVPVAVLCQGCADRVVISLQPGGSCRVSFNPNVGATATPATGAVDLQIETPGAPLRARPNGLYRRGHVTIARQSPKHSCFVFKDQQYCE